MTSRTVLLTSIVAAIALLVAASRFSAPAPQDQDAAKQEKSKEDKAKEDKAREDKAKEDKAKEEKAREEKEAKERDKAMKRAAFERELPISQEKLARAQQDVADQAVDALAAGAKIQKELQLARMKLETFEKREMPARTARGQLDLQGSKDSLDNEKEELEQLELMYKDQDLADKTREIVIRRAKRQLERANQRYALQQGDFALLTERTLPQDREKLALDLEEKERDLARAERSAQKSSMEKKIALMAAQSDIKRIEAELANLKGDGK